MFQALLFIITIYPSQHIVHLGCDLGIGSVGNIESMFTQRIHNGLRGHIEFRCNLKELFRFSVRHKSVVNVV